MSHDLHIINKQVFELSCIKEEHAFQVQNKLDYVIKDNIARIIDRTCNEISPAQNDFKIASLEIDLGKLQFDHLEEELLRVFEKEFYEKLFEIVSRGRVEGSGIISKQQNNFDALKFFLLTGSLPWFVGKPGANIVDLFFAEIITQKKEELLDFILLHFGNEKFIERLIQQSTAGIIDEIFQLLKIPKDIIDEMENIMKNILSEFLSAMKNLAGYDPGILKSSFNMSLAEITEAEKLISNFLSANYEPGGQTRFRKMAAEIVLKWIVKSSQSIHRFDNNELLLKIITNEFNIPLNLLPEKIPENKIYFNNKVNKCVEEIILMKELKEENKLIKDKESEMEISDKKFYVSNAGIILIASFLPALFNELNLLDQGKFISRQHQVKGVFLLHYLCSGKSESPEYTLQLNKILCGCPLEDPLPAAFILSKKEKDECDLLVYEMIKHWKKPGNISIESFRESFLLRDGILAYEINGWKLQVESKGYDILLQSLPWSFERIKLSWMNESIVTEWKTS